MLVGCEEILLPSVLMGASGGTIATRALGLATVLVAAWLLWSGLYKPLLLALGAFSCALVIIGGLAQIYVIIIGGQAYPLEMFPGKEVSSSFFDGVVASYTPSLPEFVLGIGGVAIALAATIVGTRVLRFLPQSLADEDVGVSVKDGFVTLTGQVDDMWKKAHARELAPKMWSRKPRSVHTAPIAG